MYKKKKNKLRVWQFNFLGHEVTSSKSYQKRSGQIQTLSTRNFNTANANDDRKSAAKKADAAACAHLVLLSDDKKDG